MADLFVPKSNGSTEPPMPHVTRTTEYPLRGRTGELVATHVREDLSDGRKRMPWRGSDGTLSLGRPVHSLPLYGSELVDAWDPETGIVIVEGEKCAEAAREAGRSALATVTGAAERGVQGAHRRGAVPPQGAQGRALAGQ